VFFLPKVLARYLLLLSTTMKTGKSLKTTKLIRSQKTGVFLPRQGTFVRDIENLGRKLILVDFGSAGEDYLFPNEVFDETRNVYKWLPVTQLINGSSETISEKKT